MGGDDGGEIFEEFEDWVVGGEVIDVAFERLVDVGAPGRR